MDCHGEQHGFTLVELVIVIVIIGILTTIGIRSVNNTMENRKFLATKKEMEVIRTAMIGDPDLKEGGSRTYFGYVGDVGDLPPAEGTGGNEGLDYLVNSHGLTGWNGPYIEVDFADDQNAFRRDAWGNPYQYSRSGGDVTLTTFGPDGSAGGGDDFTLNIGPSAAAILSNRIDVRLFNDENIVLTPADIPDDSVYMTVEGNRYASAYQSGKQVYRLGSVPIGNREVHIDGMSLIGIEEVITVSVDPGDEIRRNVTLHPPYGELQLAGAPAIVAGNPTFSVVNGGVPPLRITRMSVIWESGSGGNCWNGENPYLGEVLVDGSRVWYWNVPGTRNARVGSGSTISLDNPFTLSRGTSRSVTLIFRDDIDDSPGSAGGLNMTGVAYTLKMEPEKGPAQQVEGGIANACSDPDLRDGSAPGVSGTSVTVSFDNNGSLAAKIDAITLRWSGSSGDKVTGIAVNGQNVWSGTRSSGDIVYLNSILRLDGNTTHSMNLTFDGNMSGVSLEITFHFTDETTQTVTF